MSSEAVKRGKKSKGLTTVDIVLMAILAIVNGVAMTYLAMLNQVLTAVGGPILTSITLGLYCVSGILAMYIIRKPGACIITFVLSGVVQVLSGNPNGLISMVATITDGLGGEIAFALFAYKRFDWITMSLAGLFTIPVWFIVAAFWFGYIKWGISVMLIAFVVRCVSGLILAGWLSKVIGDILDKTGILKGFGISKQRASLAGINGVNGNETSHSG